MLVLAGVWSIVVRGFAQSCPIAPWAPISKNMENSLARPLGYSPARLLVGLPRGEGRLFKRFYHAIPSCAEFMPVIPGSKA